MAKRFTDTDKWKKNWFIDLSIKGKLLWFFVTDYCNHAGVCDYSPRLFTYFLGFNVTKDVLNDLLGEKIQWIEEDKFFVPSFAVFQYGELNEHNRAHKSVLEILEKIKNKPLISPLQGDKDKDKDKDKYKDILSLEVTWRTDFKIYQSECEAAADSLCNDIEFIGMRERYHPGLDICLSIEKAFNDFWFTEAGWKNKKATKSKVIDWKATFTNALTMKSNQVWRKK